MDDLIQQNKKAEMSKKKKSGTDVEKLMNDDRFKDMFEDEEFARDVNSDAYKLNNPVSKTYP